MAILEWLESHSGAATAIIAAVALGIALWQLRTVNKQLTYSTYLKLIEELGTKEAREDRETVHEKYGKEHEVVHKEYGTSRVSMSVDPATHPELRDVIERTVNRLDTVGYFILRGFGSRREAPEWLWEVTAAMWTMLGWYVKYEQSSRRRPYRREFGKYFEKLGQEALKRRNRNAKKPDSGAAPLDDTPPST